MALGDVFSARIAHTGVLMGIVENVGTDILIAEIDLCDAGAVFRKLKTCLFFSYNGYWIIYTGSPAAFSAF